MDKEKKNRSGSQSNNGGHSSDNKNERRQTAQPGAPSKSNRQTKGNDESGPEQETGNKKGANAV
jgi:hypothetical protein